MTWKTMKVGDVCRLINGRAYKKSELLAKGPYRVLRVGNFFTNDHWYYSDLELEPDKYCNLGDLLYAWSASFGPRIWAGEKVIYHYHIWKVEPQPALVDQRFLFWYFEWDKERIKKDQGAGTTMIHVSKGSMECRDIPVPPLPEQQRIVGFLDEAFAGIATAKANAEKNLRNASELFESFLQSTFNRLGERWARQQLVELCQSDRVITYGVIKLGDETPNGVPCLRTSNVRWLRINTDGMKRINKSLSDEFRRTILRGGEVLVNVRGTLGGVCVVAPEMSGWNISREVAMVPCDPTRIDPYYLAYWIGTQESQSWLGGVKKGAAYVGINIEDLRLLPIPLPKLLDQRAVVAQLDEVRVEGQRLESLYQQKLAALDALKKSLLHQAFSGRLT